MWGCGAWKLCDVYSIGLVSVTPNPQTQTQSEIIRDRAADATSMKQTSHAAAVAADAHDVCVLWVRLLQDNAHDACALGS